MLTDEDNDIQRQSDSMCIDFNLNDFLACLIDGDRKSRERPGPELNPHIPYLLYRRLAPVTKSFKITSD